MRPGLVLSIITVILFGLAVALYNIVEWVSIGLASTGALFAVITLYVRELGTRALRDPMPYLLGGVIAFFVGVTLIYLYLLFTM